ncbi:MULTISPECIES: DsrE family protein [unclassified Arthrobacter]|uniref:DsrE family protein n=1 Tax=unclassified Arthrobacter TaxID=235627 RepID=UPI000556FB68|nr:MULTISPECIES: hypothetical protein [unclassified Arthrobacter]MBE0010995.1 hypothetical protein [Arthrobacter sp. AET 35A]PVE15152.1 hypothetical protein DDA93_14990 [Arthrobacter sp. Bz4]
MNQIPGTKVLVLHLAGPGHAPFPDLAAAIRVARNAAAELPDVAVEILVQGPSVNQLIATEAIADISGSSISVYACGNSLHSAKIDPSTLASEVKVTPAAVAHIARRQFNGAAYMRL